MKRPLLPAFLWLALALLGPLAHAHVGSPHVVFEGRAGTVPVRVVVRQPDVVPGLAAISVRVLEGDARRVLVLPLHWTTDRAGAPRPDVAEPVPGETNLFSAALWFMARGAYGVEVRVDGPGGGSVFVPVNSVAYERRPMPPGLGVLLAGLGLLLVAGVIGIVAAAAREATLPGGRVPGRGRTLASLAAGILALGLVGLALAGGRRWWDSEDAQHVRRNLFRQFTHDLEVRPDPQGAQLQMTITDPRRRESQYRLVPDHGKLVHQFLVAEDAPAGTGVPTLVHLHPVPQKSQVYVATLPSLPAGTYRVFTDLTHESGGTQTLTNSVVIPAGVAVGRPSDPDDSVAPAVATPGNPTPIGDGLTMEFSPGVVRPGDVSVLRLRVRKSDGSPAILEPYLRMLGHAVVMRSDGSVFAHVHPAGTLSMSAARRFAVRSGGEGLGRETDANCGDLEAVPPEVAAALGRTGEVQFPYVFPQSGTYWVWVQVRVDGKIRTAGFRVEVPESAALARRR
ncbi:MAG: hypothetical protein JNL10_08055 [Verrucomicrobiales bacterium]|nr:hypothetical protein [Verrucomicrobiales bacterium]